MANYAPIPFIITREFDDNGALLEFGKIYTYQAGTTIPLGTYMDAGGFASNLNPIVLDASGSAQIFLKPEAYKFVFEDKDGNLVRTIDNISGGVLSGGGTFAVVSNYAALRAMTADFDAVLVLCRSTANDGGYGVFARVAYAADDDGININRASTVSYRRQGWTTIDPRWFGLVYGAGTAQNGAILAAQAASATYNAPVVYSGPIYVTTINFSTAGGTATFDDGCKFYSTGGAVALSFSTTQVSLSATLKGVFQENVSLSPLVGMDVKSSWFTGNGALGRFLGTLNVDACILDSEFTVDTHFSANYPLRVVSGGLITIPATGVHNIYAPSVDAQPVQWISITDPANLGTVDFGVPALPEWFRPAGFGSDSADYLVAAMKSGRVELSGAYEIHSPVTLPACVVSSAIPSGATGASTFSGPAIKVYEATTCSSLTIDGCEIYSDATGLLTVTSLYATNCFLNSPVTPLAITTTAAYLVDCLEFAGITGTLHRSSSRQSGIQQWRTTQANIENLYRLYDKPLAQTIAGGATINDTTSSHVFVDNTAGNVTITMAASTISGVSLRRVMALSKTNTVTINGTFWNGLTVLSSVELGGGSPIFIDCIPCIYGWYLCRSMYNI